MKVIINYKKKLRTHSDVKKMSSGSRHYRVTNHCYGCVKFDTIKTILNRYDFSANFFNVFSLTVLVTKFPLFIRNFDEF